MGAELGPVQGSHCESLQHLPELKGLTGSLDLPEQKFGPKGFQGLGF